MGGNINECTRLYIYNYSLYCETLKSREKIEYLTEKWNCDAAKEIILWNIKIHSCLMYDFNNIEKLSFTRWVCLWSDKYTERRLCFLNLLIDSHFTSNIYAVSHQKAKKKRINNHISHWTISIFLSFSLFHQPVPYATMLLMIDITLPSIPFFLSHVRVDIPRPMFSVYCIWY